MAEDPGLSVARETAGKDWILSCCTFSQARGKRPLRLVNDGLSIATKNGETLYIVIFTLHQFSIFQEEDNYYHYLTKNVLPYFKCHGYTMIAQRYDRDLFNYYARTGNTDDRVEDQVHFENIKLVA